MSDRVLLTGISGFLGGHTALALLGAGYAVRGSIRNLAKADAVRKTLEANGADTSRLEFVALDLLGDEGWDAAMAGMRYLVHTASPFVISMPKDPDDLIRPAVQGTERAIGAALRAGIERIVLTSSIAAIVYGHDGTRETPYTDSDWTELDGAGVNAYIKSKTLAERRAWALMEAAGRASDLAVINPAAILGPLLDEDPGTSALLIKRLLDASVPALPRFSFPIVDVRDVAAAHVAALVNGQAGGRRFAMAEKTLDYREVARCLTEQADLGGRKVPTLALPDWAVRLFALFDADVRSNIGQMGQKKILDAGPARTLLGRDLIPAEHAAVATANSLIEKRIV